MRILHFSDIHIPTENSIDFRQFISNPFIEDLKIQNEKAPFDLVVITGDIIDKGAMAFKDRRNCYNEFLKTIIDPICKELSFPQDRIFIVPGNHDIWQDIDSLILETGLQKVLNNTQAVNKYIDEDNFEGVNRIDNYKKFEHNFYKKNKDKVLTRYQSIFKFNLKSHSVGVACLNSAWRSFNSKTDRNNLIIGERQVSNSREYFKGCDIKIVLMHHPIDWLADFDKKCVGSIIENTFNILLFGHVHSGTAWLKTNMHNGLFISASPANWKYGIHDQDTTHNGYTIINYHAESFKIEVEHRRFSYNKQSYVPDNDLGDDRGIAKFQIPTSTELSLQNYKKGLVENIKTTHFSELNEHLLTYNSGTKAPQDVQSLFVFPKIVEKVAFESDKELKENILTLDEICTYNSNQIIFGIKESGKTMLIDELLIYFTNNYSEYQYIPIHIDFRKITSTRLDTVVARYLGISVTTISEFIEKNEIILLIDNLSFGEYHKKNLNIIEKFANSSKNVKILATALQVAEGTIPIELFNKKYYSAFRSLHIKAFGSTETRKLINIWFKDNSTPKIKENIDGLIGTLTKLNLPRTPLAISMFLWIIELQEGYEPINSSTMLENFMERLFHKHSKKEIYSDRFDFENKARILAEIAYKMLSENQIDYHLSSRELIDLIDDNLRLKKFDFIQAKDVLDHFIEKGILLEEQDGTDSFIRFRFSCFMHYSLMKKMEYDKDFRLYVLDDKNILMFPEEIDLYTGIKRDQSKILKQLIDMMEAEFKEPIDIIESLPETFDIIFNKEESFSATYGQQILSNLDSSNKPTQEELDVQQDHSLDKILPEKGIRKKDSQFDQRKKFELLWTLAAKVLRNTEETSIKDIKLNSYSAIIKSSMTYAFLWKIYIDIYLAEHHKDDKFKIDEEVLIQRNVLPLIHELWLKSLLGTRKLSMVFKEKIELDNQDSNVSDFEKFISVFIYSDIKGKNQDKYINKFINIVKNPHLLDMTLFKLLSYYYLRSKSKESDNKYENMLSELIVNARGQKKSRKGNIIKNFREQRKLKKLKDKRKN